ncbi:hypothetical protein V5094_13710 [Moellerella wisconsensis]|uniref:hypothetical protein n=1 Tax=Moellerella wisconsensis TaxID=158849 RepID=UPI003075F6B0
MCNSTKGLVVHHEYRIGFIVIQDSDGEYTVAELQGGYDVEKGHIIRGNLDTEGDEIFYNETTGESISVIVQGTGMSEQQSIRMIQNTRG